MEDRSTQIILAPLAECDCTEPHPSYFLNKGALSAERIARGTGRMLCAREFGCSRLHVVASVEPVST